MDLYNIRQELAMGKPIYDLPLRVTFYARVSTGKDEQAHSLQNQIQYYTDFISNNPNWVYVDGYIDEGLSGTSTAKRERFLKMIDDAKFDKFDFIITKEISRFSRNTLDSIKYTQELLQHGVGVIFQSDNINTLMPDSELRLTIMSSIAQDEVRKLSERVRFGFKRAVDKGVVLGNSRIWGYVKRNGRLVIEPEEAEIVRTIFHLYAIEQIGMRSIAKVLNEGGLRNTLGNPFSFTTLRNIIANPKYKGYYCGNKSQKYDYRSNHRKVFEEEEWVMYKDEENVPPIVSEELWDKANVILRRRSEKQKAPGGSRYDNKYNYSCKVVCAKHQTYYYRSLYRYKSGDKEVWQCKQYSENGRGKNGCTAPVIYTKELDAIMKSCYENLIARRADVMQELVKIYSSISSQSEIRIDIAKVKTQINELLRKKDKLLDLSIKGALSDMEFEARNKGFNEEIKTLQKKLEDLQLEENRNKEVRQTVESLRKMIAKELAFENGFDNVIIDSLLDKIEVCETDQKGVFDLKVHFKVLTEAVAYRINRKMKTSVCLAPYT